MSLLSVFLKTLAYISLPLLVLRFLANSSMSGRYYVRAFVYAGTMAAVASSSVILAFGMSLIGRSTDVNYYVARIFYGVASRLLNLTVEVEGEEHLNQGAGVLMCNHQSMLDILILGRVMPLRTVIMAKKSLRFTPLGPFMLMSGTIFIDRSNNARAVQSLQAASENMKKTKTSLWIYPEGTRYSSRVPDMLPLKKGGFHLAMSAGLPIIPIVTENYWRIYRKGVFNTGVIKVRILPPIPTAGLTNADMNELTTHTRNRMMEALVDISVKETPDPVDEKKKQPEPTSTSTYPLDEKKPLPSSSAPSISHPKAVPSQSDSTIVEPVAALVFPTLSGLSDSTEKVISSALSDGRRTDSTASLSMSSSFASSRNGDNGAETEEDEGMVLVGRPQ